MRIGEKRMKEWIMGEMSQSAETFGEAGRLGAKYLGLSCCVAEKLSLDYSI